MTKAQRIAHKQGNQDRKLFLINRNYKKKSPLPLRVIQDGKHTR